MTGQKGIVLHCCCAPCASACVERLLAEGRRVMLYYSNANIATSAEFEKRLTYVRWLAAHYQLELAVDPYDHATWLREVTGLENEPERGARCRICFLHSFRQTAAFAKARGWNFTTTLSVSPYKSSRVLFEAGRSFDNFEEYDFKKRDGYRRSCELAQEFGFYRQNFCGCEFSWLAMEQKKTAAAASSVDDPQ